MSTRTVTLQKSSNTTSKTIERVHSLLSVLDVGVQTRANSAQTSQSRAHTRAWVRTHGGVPLQLRDNVTPSDSEMRAPTPSAPHAPSESMNWAYPALLSKWVMFHASKIDDQRDDANKETAAPAILNLRDALQRYNPEPLTPGRLLHDAHQSDLYFEILNSSSIIELAINREIAEYRAQITHVAQTLKQMEKAMVEVSENANNLFLNEERQDMLTYLHTNIPEDTQKLKKLMNDLAMLVQIQKMANMWVDKLQEIVLI